MNKKVLSTIIFIKNVILFAFGIFFFLGAIIMITTDITATIFFLVVSFICLFFSKNIIINYYKKTMLNKIKMQQENQKLTNEANLKLKEMKLNNDLEMKKIEIEYQNKLNSIRNTAKQQEYNKNKKKVIELTDTKQKVTIERIQELYKEKGIDVKVIGIKDNKYSTEYEIILQQGISKNILFNISNKIREDFNVDGVNFKTYDEKPNRLFITIPLEYNKN